MPGLGTTVTIVIIVFFVVLVLKSVRVVPQQYAWVVERLGRFHRVLEPGLNLIIPLVDRVAYKHSLKEVPMVVPEQVCITKDNTQLAVDGVLYYQVTDPRLASYGTANYLQAITQLAQTTMRSEIGKMELDKTLESRDSINRSIVSVLDEAGQSWGVKVLRYEIKDLTPPELILRAMQTQITAEREKRAVIAKSEGGKQQDINLAEGDKQSKILESEGQKQSAINKAQGEATAIRLIADATASAITTVSTAMSQPGGQQAANLKIAESYMAAFTNLAKTNNTMIIPANLSDVATMVASVMTVLQRATPGADPSQANKP
jgi:regulator of protease activity HflC (stomatin/prohibitin superfamily)